MDDVANVANSQSSASQSSASSLGDGYKEFFGKASSAFSQKELKQHQFEKDTTDQGQGKITAAVISSAQALHDKGQKASGLSLDLGFFKIGHKSETEFETEYHENTAFFLITATRKGISKTFDFSKDLMTEESRKRFEDNPESFYRTYGSHYVSSVTSGAYAHLLIYARSSSKEEAKRKASKLNAAYNSEDKSGSGAFGNDGEFAKTLKEIGAEIEIKFNVPQGVLNNLKDEDIDPLSLEGGMKLAKAVTTLDVSKANPVFSELSTYPFSDQALDQIDLVNSKLTRTFGVGEFAENATRQLGRLEEYENFTSDFAPIHDTEKVRSYFEHKEALLGDLIGSINDNIFADTSEIENSIILFDEENNNLRKEVILERVTLELAWRTLKRKSDTDNLQDYANEIAKSANSGKKGTEFYAKVSTVFNGGQQLTVKYSSKNEITPPIRPLPADVTWACRAFQHESFDPGTLINNLRNWMQENLTPWQYYHCSVQLARYEKNHKYYKASVTYPEDASKAT